MYRIAIIDNDIGWAEQLKEMLIFAMETVGLRECFCEIYSDTLEFLENYTEKREYFLILMDVRKENVNRVRGQVDGIRIAEILRNHQREDDIVFVSDQNNYAMESYMVGAISYLVKPLDQEQCQNLVNKVISSKNRIDWDITLRDGSRIRLDELCYIKYQNTGYTFSFSNVSEVGTHSYQSKASAEEILQFIKPYSCLYPVDERVILNLLMIRSVEETAVLLQNDHYIHLSRRKIQEVRQAFHQFLMEREAV